MKQLEKQFWELLSEEDPTNRLPPQATLAQAIELFEREFSDDNEED